MKITLRIPTLDPYAYIELEDTAAIPDPQEVLRSYESFKRAIKGSQEAKTGLGRVEWNKLIDGLLCGSSMPTEQFEGMSDKQKEFYHEVEKALVRLKGKGLLANDSEGQDYNLDNLHG